MRKHNCKGLTWQLPLIAAIVLVCLSGWHGLQGQTAPAVSVAPQQSVQFSPRSVVFPDGGFPSLPTSQPIPNPITGTADATTGQTQPVLPNTGRDLDTEEVQNAPGNNNPYAQLDLYQTMLREAASTRFGVTPLSINIYAPQGYYDNRDQQDGPGVPAYRPITPPVPVTPEERLKFVTRGVFPGSFLVPGTNTSFRIRGFVRLTALHDFNPVGTPDIFVTNSIPVPQQSGSNSNMTARPSRIAFESWTPTSINDWNVHTFIEGDFFNGQGQAAGGGGNPFRLRHAFIDFGYFRMGQQNTVFMDAGTWPALVDFQGPNGWVNQRRPTVRMTVPLADRLYWAGGIEQPFSDINTNGLGTNVQQVPDFATHVRYEADRGHAQLSGLARVIGYRPTGGSATQLGAWGMSASTVIHPWAMLLGTNPVRDANPNGLTRSRMIGLVTSGWGIGRYIQDTVGQGFDAQVNPINGNFDLVTTSAWLLSYEHWLTEKWLTSVTYSTVIVGNTPGQAGDTYSGGKYLAANIWYIPVRNVSIGCEYLYGQRKNLNGQSGQANRLQLMFQYNF